MATKVRYQIIGVATLAAIMLYVDRVCIAEIVKLKEFQSELGLSKEQIGLTLSAFFFSYALCQVPAGVLSDRIGARYMLPLYVCVWSICTLVTGLAASLGMLLTIRMIFGIAQAGCYPTAGSLIRRWIPLEGRGTASAIVSFGGRFGAALTPVLTAWLLRDYFSWRALLVIYGTVGFGVALAFWLVCRESPEEHPGCDQAERDLINPKRAKTVADRASVQPNQINSHEALNAGAISYENLNAGAISYEDLNAGAISYEEPLNAGAISYDDSPSAVAASHNDDSLSILPLLTSVTMWLMCLLQFGINVGWVFLVTWLPTYLQEVKHIDPAYAGFLSTLTLTAGVIGMLLGGPLTDYLAIKIGKRLARSLPMFVCYIVALVAYLSCMWLETPMAFVLAAALVAFATDLSVPSIWAYMQDVGGKNTAACFGWGNMWGNLGAATTPLLVPYVLKYVDTNKDWHEAFILFAIGYLVAALCALGLNANQSIAERRVNS